MKASIYIIMFTLLSLGITSQAPVGDCIGAIPVCSAVYNETDSPVGPGDNPNEINSGNCVQNEQNSVWYIFTVQNSGDLGFLITPNDLNDDYDWTIFNITGKTCEDIRDDPSLVASCNAAGGFTCDGLTGADNSTIYDFQNFGCGNDPPSNVGGFTALNAFLPVITGETYVLALINWSSSINGYTLDFSLGDADILDDSSPSLISVDIPPASELCDIESLPVTISENILCSTFQESQVQLTTPGAVIDVTVQSNNCDNGGIFDSQFNIMFDPPLTQAGIYTITIFDGPEDLCGNQMVGNTYTFEIVLPNLGTINVLDTVLCNDEVLFVDAFENGVDSYEWQDGQLTSAISINAEGDYTVMKTTGCSFFSEVYTLNYQDDPIITDVTSEMSICTLANGSIMVNNYDATGSVMFSLDMMNFQSSPQFMNLDSGDYVVYIQDDLGCISSQVETVGNMTPLLDINMPNDTTIRFMDIADISTSINGSFNNFFWTGDSTTMSCFNCLDPTFSPLFTQTYTLHVFNEFGCEYTEDITIRVEIDYDTYIPNTFSPNNDGINDKFTLFGGLALTEINSLQIYSRWGEKVFDEENMMPNDIVNGWDGTFKTRSVNSGVFVYKATVTFIDGTIKEIQGSITVVK